VYKRQEYLIDRMVKQMNLWHAVNLGKRGWDNRQESPELHKYDWEAIVADAVKWYDAGARAIDETTCHAAFAPVVERTVRSYNAPEDSWIDLDTGKLFTPPKNLDLINGARPVREARQKWCRSHGIDAWGRGRHLRTFDMTLSPVPTRFWDDVTPEEFDHALRTAVPNGRTAGIRHRTFAFRTREGARGLFRIVDIENDAGALKLRTKMLRTDADGKTLIEKLPGMTAEQAERAEALIRQFSNRRFSVRQDAVDALVKMGRGVLPLIRKTLAETDDNEVKLRCEMVFERLARK